MAEDAATLSQNSAEKSPSETWAPNGLTSTSATFAVPSGTVEPDKPSRTRSSSSSSAIRTQARIELVKPSASPHSPADGGHDISLEDLALFDYRPRRSRTLPMKSRSGPGHQLEENRQPTPPVIDVAVPEVSGKRMNSSRSRRDIFDAGKADLFYTLTSTQDHG